MLINTVIIVLREVLEVAYLTSLLLAISYFLQIGFRWFYAAVTLGLLGSIIYASQLSLVSEWFDYTGQEIVNGSMQLIMFICLAWLITCKKYASTAMMTTVILAIIREGAELLVYYSGITGDAVSPVFTGSFIGLGIGLSIGALLYYALLNFNKSTAVLLSQVLLIITASGLLSQAIGFFIQADIISSQSQVWDSSSVLSEESLLGQLLYALVAYESTPAAVQVLTWFISVSLLSIVVFFNVKRGQLSE